MGKANPGLPDLLRHAARRHGVIDLGEAERLRVSLLTLRRAVDNGVLERPERGVFVATGAPPTWEQRVLVAASATNGVASHRCAARLHRLDGFADAPVELTMGPGGTSADRLIHRTASIDRSMVTSVANIPVTSIARTLVDLGAVVNDDGVEQALDDALRRGTNLRWVTQTLDSAMRPGPSGCGALVRVLSRPDRRGPIPDSMFERWVERVVGSGLPRPERQVPVAVDGRAIAHIDHAWPGLMLGLEADSELWHWGPRRGRQARLRHNRLVAAGWQMIYASWQDLDDPNDLLAQLRRLHRRSA